MILLVGMCYNSFIISVSTLTVFQSWFRIDGNLVFFSDVILCIVSTFIFSSCASVFSVYLGIWCFDYYYFAFQFGQSILVFQYLLSRFLYSGLGDMIPYLLVDVFLIF